MVDAGKPLSKCGKCARYMKLISVRPSRMYCTTCEEVLNLPQVPFKNAPFLCLNPGQLACLWGLDILAFVHKHAGRSVGSGQGSLTSTPLQGGTVKLYKGLACPLDGYEIVLFSLTGPDAKTYPLCPFCYNNPPAGAQQVCYVFHTAGYSYILHILDILMTFRGVRR